MNTAIVKQHKQMIENLQNLVDQEHIRFVFLPNRFDKTMVKTALLTLDNIQDLIMEYERSYEKEKSDGEKILLVFGLLQGLFVAVDALYSINKGLQLEKLLININQNAVLRSIKHIRNDVVGHPTFRYYNGDQIGFCRLDIDHITQSEFVYQVITFKKNQEHVAEKQVDLRLVIEQYFQEANSILEQTIAMLDLTHTEDAFAFIDLIPLLFFQYQNKNQSYSLLEEIKEGFFKFSHIKENSQNRVTWRLSLIKEGFMYEQEHPSDAFIGYLVLCEIRKLYSVTYNLMKFSNKKKKYRALDVLENAEVTLLRKKIQTNKWNITKHLYVLQDINHPLFENTMERIIETFKDDADVRDLISWIQLQIDNKNESLIYMIGSELKKS